MSKAEKAAKEAATRTNGGIPPEETTVPRAVSEPKSVPPEKSPQAPVISPELQAVFPEGKVPPKVAAKYAAFTDPKRQKAYIENSKEGQEMEARAMNGKWDERMKREEERKKSAKPRVRKVRAKAKEPVEVKLPQQVAPQVSRMRNYDEDGRPATQPDTRVYSEEPQIKNEPELSRQPEAVQTPQTPFVADISGFEQIETRPGVAWTEPEQEPKVRAPREKRPKPVDDGPLIQVESKTAAQEGTGGHEKAEAERESQELGEYIQHLEGGVAEMFQAMGIDPRKLYSGVGDRVEAALKGIKELYEDYKIAPEAWIKFAIGQDIKTQGKALEEIVAKEIAKRTGQFLNQGEIDKLLGGPNQSGVENTEADYDFKYGYMIDAIKNQIRSFFPRGRSSP